MLIGAVFDDRTVFTIGVTAAVLDFVILLAELDWRG